MSGEDRAQSAHRPAAHGGKDLTTGPIGRTLLLFALPTLGSSVLQSLNGSINAIWVGRFLGEGALAATSNANLVMFLMFAALFGFGMAATILIGQNMGRRDVDGVRRALGTAIGLFLCASLLIAVLGWVFAPALLHLLGTSPQVFGLALAYLRVIFLSMPASFLSVLLMMGLRGTGDSMTPLWFMGLAAILDVGLNPVLILGIGPAPRMGIAGAATATLIATYISLLAMLAYIYGRDLLIRLRGPELRYLWPDAALLKLILAKGLPMALQMFVVSGSSLVMIGLVNREGVAVTAAYGVAVQLWAYVQMPAMALGAAVSAMAAQNIGARQWDRIARITRSGIVMNVLMTGGLIIVLTLIDRQALGLFLTAGSPSLPIAVHMNWIVGWSFVLFGVTFVLFGVVRANGAVIGPLVILAVAMLPVRLGLVYLTHGWLGRDSLWWAYAVSSTVAMLMAVAFYRHADWRGARLVEPAINTPSSAESTGTSYPAASPN